MPCTTAQLKTAQKWRDNNREKYREIVNLSRKTFYNNNKQKEKERILRIYYFKKRK